MRRRDFAAGLLIAAAAPSALGQEGSKQHRIAIILAGPVARLHDGVRPYQAFFGELRRLGDVEGQNLTVGRYSHGGRPEGYADLARKVVSQAPDLIVASTDAMARAVRAATTTIPIVWIGGDPVQAGLATSLAQPGGNITGVTVNAGDEIWGKRLQVLKEAVPSASKIAFLNTQTASPRRLLNSLQQASRRLQISVTDMRLEEATPSEVQRAFAEIADDPPDAIMVSSIGDLVAHRQLIVELAERNRLPAIYPWRDYIEAGGLMAYASDDRELWRRIADDIHQILNGAKPGDIPIYLPAKYELFINLKAAKTIGLTIPPALLVSADEVIE